MHIREERAVLLVEWKKQQEARKAEIATRRAEWGVEKQEWEVEKAAAKASKKWPILGKLPAAILRPLMAATNDESSDDNNTDNDD